MEMPKEVGREKLREMLDDVRVEDFMGESVMSPLRRCACEWHYGDESWHGNILGYTYHRCDCLDCRTAIRAYYARPDRRKVTSENNARRGHARRARRLGLDHEDYSRLGVAKEAHWKCGLCGYPISRDAAWPHPDSLSIDHIIPLARGGHDVKSNVRAAHLRCNLRKNDRLDSELSSFDYSP
jgi:5-methylcytosine-specific restriction endonuclease McrA